MKYLALIIGLGLFYALKLMKNKGASFSSRVIFASLLGIGLGLSLRGKQNFLESLVKFMPTSSLP